MPEILLCGAEGEQFLFENTLTTLGADDKRRGSVQLETGQQMFRQFSGSYDDFWVHFRCTSTETYHSPHSGTLMEIRAGTQVVARVYTLQVDNTNYASFRFDVFDGGQIVSGPDFPHALEEFINYDIRVQTTGSSRTVTFYRNEVLRHQVTYSGSFAEPNAVLFASRTNWVNEDDTRYQDIIITDALPTVGMELATLVPSAVGSYSDFSNDYTAIDDAGYDQSTVISTTTPGDRESWFFSDPEFNLGDKVIYGVAITTVAQTDLAGVISDFEPFLRIEGTNYPAAQIGANNVAPNAYTTVFTNNPATTNPWTQAELVGLESGLRAV
ncbi:hypothetical protein MAL1_00078 [Bacteriophage DSS3_MAL1]|nr:hypothetical protein MAL1_00078 [Bacteriophage DSS3_MAL1]